jgi:hypothetical protein
MEPAPMRVLASLACLSLGAVAGAANPPIPGTLSPADAIKGTAADPQLGKSGSFAMLVRGTGKSHGHVFLNSEADYRDPRNLSVDIDISAAKLLARELGSAPDEYYKDKWIVVRGTARRVPIIVTDNKGPLGKYFQTHVPVRLPSQITVVADPVAC